MTSHPRRSTRILPPPTPDAIRAAREAAGHSQRQAALTLAVAPRTWQFWEDAQRGMPAGKLQLYLLLTGQTTVARARQALTAGMISPSPL